MTIAVLGARIIHTAVPLLTESSITHDTSGTP